MSTESSLNITAPSDTTATIAQETDCPTAGSKRRRDSDEPDKPDQTSTFSEPNEHVSSEKRPRLSTQSQEGSEQQIPFTYWLAFDLITAGRQGIELGRDQTPIVQVSAALGRFSENTIIDRFSVNIRPESFVRALHTSAESQGQSDSSVQPEDSLYWLHNQAHLLNGAFADSVLSSAITETAHEFTGPRSLVPISLDAMKAARWNDSSQLPNQNSPNLPEAMNLLMSWLRGHNVSVAEGPQNSSLIVVTEGHLQLRNVLYPQAAYLGLDRSFLQQTPWCTYVSILDWCKQAQEAIQDSSTNCKRMVNVMDAMTVLGLQQSSETDAGVNATTKVERIAQLISVMMEKGVPLCEAQVINSVYEHKVFSKTMDLEDSCVVEVRQVPWSATPSIIAGFFAGLNLLPGGVAIRLQDGRRSNTAIVAFASSLNAQLALARHQHQFCGALFPEHPQEGQQTLGLKDKQSQSLTKPNTLQVYSASAREFIQCAGCDQPPVAEFLDQLTSGEQVVVRVRGLPFTATKQQILEFFKAVNATVFLEANGIYLVSYPEGRPTGDAFVLFSDDKTATRALLRHKDYLGDRYVELFKASPSEMVQVCHNVSKQAAGSHNSQKSSTGSSDQQGRGRSALNLASSPFSNLAPYVLQNPNAAATLASMKPGINLNALSSIPLQSNLLSPNLLSLGLRSSLLSSGLPALDRLTTSNFSLPLASVLSNQLLGQASLLAPTSFQSTNLNMPMSTRPLGEVVTKDLKDPTDPDCPYARQLPPNGVSALIQLSGLPLETSRHDMRLYLGPVNMAKVYRMRQMDMKPDQTTTTWLVSVLNTVEAIQLIRDLVNRPFTVSNNPNTGTAKVLHNLPLFSLYHVNADKSVIPTLLTDPSFGIPLNRIYGVGGDPQQNESWAANSFQNSQLSEAGQMLLKAATPENPTRSLETSPSFVNSSMLPEAVNSQLVQSILAQTNAVNASHSLTNCQSTPNSSASGLQLGAVYQPMASTACQLGNPVLYQLQQNQLNTGNLGSINDPSRSLTWPTVGGMASTVILTGAPLNATAEELMSLFQPISHLLTTPPQFTLYQPQANGTANFLATFSNAIEAQAAALYCPNGSLRNRQYAVGVACLVPNVTSTIPQAGQPAALLDPTATTYNPLAPGSNLMFLSAAMTNPSLF